MTALRAGAIAVAALSGACALIALTVGSPLQFGVSLALSAAGWIGADFFERMRAPRPHAIPVAPINRVYRPGHVVFPSRRESVCFSPSTSRPEARLAA